MESKNTKADLSGADAKRALIEDAVEQIHPGYKKTKEIVTALESLWQTLQRTGSSKG